MTEVTSTLARWTHALVEREVDARVRDEFLHRHGGSGGAVPDAPIALSAIWEELTRAHADPLAGVHFAASLPESAFGIVGYLALTSDTALDGLRRVAEFYRLVKGAGAMSVTERRGIVQVVDCPANGAPPWPRHLAEAVLYAYKAFIERCTGRPLKLRVVRLQHVAPARAQLVEEAFGVAVAFGAETNELVIDRVELEHRLLRADPSLHAYLRSTAERLGEASARPDPMIGALEEAVAAALPSGAVSLERAARSVGIGARTLQRRLRERAMTFQDLVDQVRRSAARRLLEDPDLSVKEVAFLLGFSDPRALRRARKRWKEKDPVVS